MAEEKIFTIPLRDAFLTERTHRSRKAMDLVRAFLEKNMKAEEIVIGKSINEEVWKRGIQKPPRRIRVHALKDDGRVYAELVGIDIKPPSKEELKKKAEKKEEKEKKIKEERKERRKKTIQEELEEEEGKKKEVPEKISEVEEKEVEHEEEAMHAEKSMDSKKPE